METEDLGAGMDGRDFSLRDFERLLRLLDTNDVVAVVFAGSSLDLSRGKRI